MAKIYSVYTAAVSYKPEFKPQVKELCSGGETPVYVRRVRANSRLEAFNKCLPDLQKELPKIGCKYLSVFVGEKCNPTSFASRLTPFQLDSTTGQLRQVSR